MAKGRTGRAPGDIHRDPCEPAAPLTWPRCGCFDPEKLSDPDREESAFRNWAVFRQSSHSP